LRKQSLECGTPAPLWIWYDAVNIADTGIWKLCSITQAAQGRRTPKSGFRLTKDETAQSRRAVGAPGECIHALKNSLLRAFAALR